jgi:hypothetical protein
VTTYEPGTLNGHEYTLSVMSSAEPLKVTLVWTDEPAQLANGVVVNNLDLQVVSPNAATFLGNHFVGGASATGGVADAGNNVEQILIKSPVPGNWIVRVIATSVTVGTQGYALVATAQLATGTVPNPPTNLQVVP